MASTPSFAISVGTWLDSFFSYRISKPNQIAFVIRLAYQWLRPEGTYNADHVNALLSQAKTLGDKLKVQFDTASGLPAANINFTTNTAVNGQFIDPLNNVTYNATNTAVAGTLVLEFYRLADLSGDNSFRELVSYSVQSVY